MNIILIILIFCIVLFIYLHVYFHLKYSDDLEIYDIENTTKERLAEICDLRQPLQFKLDTDKFAELKMDNLLMKYPNFDINLRTRPDTNDKTAKNLFIPLPINNFKKLTNDDTEGKYLTENNQDFLEETTLVKQLKLNDNFIKPNMAITKDFDFIIGSKDSHTILRYELNYRSYFLCTEGTVDLKLYPPRSGKYLHMKNDYYNLEFRSEINPWNVQKEYSIDFSKVQSLHITLNKGQIIYIPAYWIYSFRLNSSESQILAFRYKTFMNTISILPQLVTFILQRYNTKYKIVDNLKTNILT